MRHSGEHTCVHCAKEFNSNVSLDKHAGCCKKRKTIMPTANTRRTWKRARHEPPDEDDNLTGHDLDHEQVRTLQNCHRSSVD